MSKCILSVNGNRAMNYLLQTILEKDYEFVPVSDIYQALSQLRTRRKMSVLVIDIDFQTELCWKLVEHIKSSKLFQIPIIILTSVNNEVIRQKCYEYEIDDIFFKPFNPLDLTTAVKSIMQVKVPSNI